jgi:hypothetical protein
MTRRVIARIGWTTFAILVVCTFAAPKPYSGWAWFVCLMLVSASLAFTLSLQSSKSHIDLLKNAVITCVVIGGLCGLFHGEPSVDDSGDVIDEGFPTTFNDKAGVAVKVFLQLLAGAYVGIKTAELVRNDERKSI